MSDSFETLRFFVVVFSLGFVTGEMTGKSLSFNWLIISIIALWVFVYVLGYLVRGDALGGLTTLAIVWSLIGVGAMVGSVVSASKYGYVVVPFTLLVALYAANKWPLFALFLAIMAAGALFSRFGAKAFPGEEFKKAARVVNKGKWQSVFNFDNEESISISDSFASLGCTFMVSAFAWFVRGRPVLWKK